MQSEIHTCSAVKLCYMVIKSCKFQINVGLYTVDNPLSAVSYIQQCTRTRQPESVNVGET